MIGFQALFIIGLPLIIPLSSLPVTDKTLPIVADHLTKLVTVDASKARDRVNPVS